MQPPIIQRDIPWSTTIGLSIIIGCFDIVGVGGLLLFVMCHGLIPTNGIRWKTVSIAVGGGCRRNESSFYITGSSSNRPKGDNRKIPTKTTVILIVR